MDSNNNLHTTPEELEKIRRVRKHFMDQTTIEPSLFYPQDIKLVKSNDWWTLRFVKWNQGDEEKALKQMVNTFKWRKSFQLHDRNVNDIPNEFAKVAAIFPYGYDHKGRPVIYIRVKVYRKVQQLEQFFQWFVAGIVNHVDTEGGHNGFVIVWDVIGVGLMNFDAGILQFLVSLLQNYYPYGLRYSIIYNMPKVLRPLWSMTKFFIGGSANTFSFCNSADDMKKYIPEQWLLRYMGGKSDFDFTDFEEVRGAPSVHEIAHKYGFTDSDVSKLLKMFKENIKEATLLRRGSTK